MFFFPLLTSSGGQRIVIGKVARYAVTSSQLIWYHTGVPVVDAGGMQIGYFANFCKHAPAISIF